MNSERLHALDAVRGFAMLAGVLLHATLSFLPGIDVMKFPIPDSVPSVTLGVLFFVIHMFRMTTFFVIAGFFAHLLVDRLGPGGFIRNRSVRVLVPLIVGWIATYPATMAVFLWASPGAHDVSLAAVLWSTVTLRQFPLMHLWFLYLLVLGYAVILIGRAVWVSAIDAHGRIGIRVDRLLRALIHGPFAVVVLAAPTALALLFFAGGWTRWFGVPPPDLSFIPGPASVVAYGGAFGLGWLLHRQVDLFSVWERRWPRHLVAAIALTGVSLFLVGPKPELIAAVRSPNVVLYTACYTMASWAWTFAIVGIALRFFNQRSAVRRYVSDASYWIYLVHLPLVFFLQAAVMDLSWHWSIKFVVILITALAVLFGSYHLLVRDTVLGVILNGHRYGRRGSRLAAIEPRPSIV